MKSQLRVVPIFLLGAGQNLISQRESDEDTETRRALEGLGLGTESGILVRKGDELDGIVFADVDCFLVFPFCPERFSSLNRLADSKLPFIILGEGEAFPDALDTYAYLADRSNVETALTSEEVRAKLKAVEAARWVKNAKVCVFGMEDLKPEDVASWKNPITLHKLNIHHVKPERFIETYKKTDRAKARNLAKKWINESEVKEPSPEDVAKSARVYLAMKRIIQETAADVAYVPWCGQFTKDLGTKMCFAMAKLADDGTPVGCWRGENLLPMHLLRAVSRKPTFVCEADRHEGDVITLRHCFAPSTIADCKIVLRRWRDMKGTVTGYCQLPKGEVTLVNSGIGDKIVVAKARVLDCKDLGNKTCRMTIWTRFENEELIHKLVGREFAMIYGDYTKEAKEAGAKLGLGVL